jgi:sugar diacid utilization regulator
MQTGPVSELQSLTDRLGERLSLSVAIDDPQMRLLSYSPHYGAVDEQRLASILHRKANPEASEWAYRHGAHQATSWFRLPSNPELGMMSRVCVPIRSHGLHLGYLWLIDPNKSLTPEQIALAEQAADEAALILYHERLNRDLQQARERELLRDLLNPDPAVRAHAVTGLAEENLIQTDRPLRVLTLDTTDPPDRPDRSTAAELALAHARWLIPSRRSLHLMRPDHGILVIVIDRNTRPADLAARIKAEYAKAFPENNINGPRIGIGTQVAKLADAHLSYREAQHALSIGRALDMDGITEWSDLGIYRFIAELPLDKISMETVHPALAKIRDSNATGDLLDTLETYLDLAGDIKATSEQLAVHRTTLYNRLAKIEKLGDVDLHHGTDRLALHLGLKIAHLSSGPSRVTRSANHHRHLSTQNVTDDNPASKPSRPRQGRARNGHSVRVE